MPSQRCSDDSSIVGCINENNGEEYRRVKSSVRWCHKDHLQLNISQTKELGVDVRRDRMPLTPVTIQGVEVEVGGWRRTWWRRTRSRDGT